MTDSILIVAERENSSMASNWTEYLCLRKGSEKSFQLFTGMYEGLDDASKYYNDEIEDYDLPEEIKGKKVVRIDDDVVTGGELGYFDTEDMIEFDHLSDTDLAKWLNNSRWNKMPNITLKINDAITHIKSSD